MPGYNSDLASALGAVLDDDLAALERVLEAEGGAALLHADYYDCLRLDNDFKHLQFHHFIHKMGRPFTLVHVAAMTARIECLLFLAAADPGNRVLNTCTDKGMTGLMFTMYAAHNPQILYGIKFGDEAMISHTFALSNSHYSTPLANMVRVLLALGVDPYHRDHGGKSAFDYAGAKCSESASMLRRVLLDPVEQMHLDGAAAVTECCRYGGIDPAWFQKVSATRIAHVLSLLCLEASEPDQVIAIADAKVWGDPLVASAQSRVACATILGAKSSQCPSSQLQNLPIPILLHILEIVRMKSLCFLSTSTLDVPGQYGVVPELQTAWQYSSEACNRDEWFECEICNKAFASLEHAEFHEARCGKSTYL